MSWAWLSDEIIHLFTMKIKKTEVLLVDIHTTPPLRINLRSPGASYFISFNKRVNDKRAMYSPPNLSSWLIGNFSHWVPRPSNGEIAISSLSRKLIFIWREIVFFCSTYSAQSEFVFTKINCNGVHVMAMEKVCKRKAE